MESALTTAPPSHRRACVPVTVSPRTAASRPRAASSSMRHAGVRQSTQSWRFSTCCRRLVGGRERGARASVRGARRGAPDAHRSAGRFPQSRSRRRGDDLDPRGTRHRDFVRKRRGIDYMHTVHPGAEPCSSSLEIISPNHLVGWQRSLAVRTSPGSCASLLPAEGTWCNIRN